MQYLSPGNICYIGAGLSNAVLVLTVLSMEELLIELVREKPELYDMSSTLYSDNIHKNKVWDEIGRTLNKSGKFLYVYFQTIQQTHT